MKKLSIVIPTCNEEKNIHKLVLEIKKHLQNVDYEIIFVDDSSDNTVNVIKKEQKANNSIILKHRVKGNGLSGAVIEGINLANNDIIAVMDADLQHPPYLLENMYREIIKGADFVIPSRFIAGGSDGGLNLYRKLVSFVARGIAKLYIWNFIKISDITSGIFCFRKSNIDKNKKLNGIGWKIMLEVLGKSYIKNIVEIPYKFRSRNDGESKMSKKIMLEYLHQLKSLKKERNKRFDEINQMEYQY